MLPDDVADPAGFVLAACDLREKRIEAVRPERWLAWPAALPGEWIVAGLTRGGPDPHPIATTHGLHSAELEAVHVAAEANPAHALAEVALWRGVAKRHQRNILRGPESVLNPNRCQWCNDNYPCPDLLAVVAAARAYLTGTGG